jgi:hypothetical protein
LAGATQEIIMSANAFLPFTLQEFLRVFAAYNLAVWPAVLVAYVLGALAIIFVLRPSALHSRLVAVVLAAMWAWSGIAYHWLYLSTINQAALLFGAAFVGQAIIFLKAAWRGQLLLSFRPSAAGFIGVAMIGYAALVYPVLGLMAGQHLTELPMFGVTPCPVTIFTFGCMLLTEKPVSWRMLAIPVLWSVIGGSAALMLGIWQDWMLLLSGALSIFLLRRSALLEMASPAFPTSRAAP